MDAETADPVIEAKLSWRQTCAWHQAQHPSAAEKRRFGRGHDQRQFLFCAQECREFPIWRIDDALIEAISHERRIEDFQGLQREGKTPTV